MDDLSRLGPKLWHPIRSDGDGIGINGSMGSSPPGGSCNVTSYAIPRTTYGAACVGRGRGHEIWHGHEIRLGMGLGMGMGSPLPRINGSWWFGSQSGRRLTQGR